MWLESRFQLCPTDGGVLFIEGGDRYGAPFLVERLKQERRVAWFSLSPSVADDPVAIGNLLAESINVGLGGNLLQNALPYLVHLRTLAQHRDLLTDLTLVVSGAHHSWDLARAAVDACGRDIGLWLISEAAPEGLGDFTGLTERDLQMTFDEARDLAPSGLSEALVRSLYQSSCGAYTSYIREVNQAAGLPEIVLPGPAGWEYSEQDARLEDPADVFEALTRLERWDDALEVAVDHLPDRVETLIEHAGPLFQRRGLLARLHLLLTILPARLQTLEQTLEWRLVAAHYTGQTDLVLPQVRRFLRDHEAPSLRARYATFLPFNEGLGEAARAAAAEPSPLTLWQYGRIHPDAERGVELLTESVGQAELHDDAFSSARAAGSLAARFNDLGRFREGRSWAEWGLRVFDESGLQDGARRLHLLTDLAFAKTMLGETSGLIRQLEDYLETLEEVLPAFSANVRQVLADLYRAEGNVQECAEFTAVNWQEAPRGQKGLRAYQHVRSLLEIGALEEAQELARTGLALSAGLQPFQDMRARLALGVSQSFTEPAAAVGTLTPIVEARNLTFEHRAVAALHYLLAKPDGFSDIPEDLAPMLQELGDTALRVLSGPPEVFHPIWTALRGGKRSVLELRTLGHAKARLEGAELKLTKRQWEILVALAMHPKGLTYERLHAFLLHDMGRVSVGTLRSHVSHLRDRVPISDNPYRIEVPFNLDALEVHDLLKQGKIREAIALVGGPLLPRSTLPGIREVGEQIEQEIRESVLSSGDPEALYSATSLWEDDLEVWERSLETLHPRDPRVPLLRARVNALREEFDAV